MLLLYFDVVSIEINIILLWICYIKHRKKEKNCYCWLVGWHANRQQFYGSVYLLLLLCFPYLCNKHLEFPNMKFTIAKCQLSRVWNCNWKMIKCNEMKWETLEFWINRKTTDWKTERLKMENVIKSTVNCLQYDVELINLFMFSLLKHFTARLIQHP